MRKQPQVPAGDVQIKYQEDFLHGKDGQALEQGGGTAVPGRVQETCGHCLWTKFCNGFGSVEVT